jgi:hypothetical protein
VNSRGNFLGEFSWTILVYSRGHLFSGQPGCILEDTFQVRKVCHINNVTVHKILVRGVYSFLNPGGAGSSVRGIICPSGSNRVN